MWCLPELGGESPREWSARVLGAPVEAATSLPGVSHGFTHFELEIEPWFARLASASPRIMEPDRWVWYNAGSPARLGLAAVVSRLIAALPPMDRSS